MTERRPDRERGGIGISISSDLLLSGEGGGTVASAPQEIQRRPILRAALPSWPGILLPFATGRRGFLLVHGGGRGALGGVSLWPRKRKHVAGKQVP